MNYSETFVIDPRVCLYSGKQSLCNHPDCSAHDRISQARTHEPSGLTGAMQGRHKGTQERDRAALVKFLASTAPIIS